jgi:Na+/melibiose symporter-like transporter
MNSSWSDHLFQGKRKYVLYLTSWGIVLTLVIAPVSPTPKTEEGICNIIEIYGDNLHIVSRVYGALAMVFFISTIVLYILTAHNVRKRYMKTFAIQMETRKTDVEAATSSSRAANASTRAANASVQNIDENRRRKAIESLKVVGIVILLFVVFTGPFVIYMFTTLFNVHISHVPIFILGGLASVNSALNPIVYGWRIEPLRNEVKLPFQNCIARLNNG